MLDPVTRLIASSDPCKLSPFQKLTNMEPVSKITPVPPAMRPRKPETSDTLRVASTWTCDQANERTLRSAWDEGR